MSDRRRTGCENFERALSSQPTRPVFSIGGGGEHQPTIREYARAR